jgi:hypothetical protein
LNNNYVGHFGANLFGDAIRVTETHALQAEKLISTRGKAIDQDMESDVSVCIGENTVIFFFHSITVASEKGREGCFPLVMSWKYLLFIEGLLFSDMLINGKCWAVQNSPRNMEIFRNLLEKVWDSKWITTMQL